MISAIFTLLGALGGGALRLLPELFDAWANRGQKENAVRLAELALEQAKAELTNKLEVARLGAENIEAEGRAAIDKAKAEALVLDHQAQAQLTGVKWADALNVSVRPTVTYLFVALFVAFKLVVLIDAWKQTATVTSLLPVIWNTDDAAMFAAVMSFWFADAALSRRAKR